MNHHWLDKRDLPKLFQHWILERWNIKLRKDSNEPKPWTSDTILQQYRFCNVRREDDTVTKFVRKWMEPHAHHKNLVLAAAIARYTNVINTISEIGFPYEWDPDEALRKLVRLEESGHKVWTSAYVVSTNGHAIPKAQYVVKTVLNAVAGACSAGRWPTHLGTLCQRLTAFNGVGTFMAGQIIADLKNTEDSQWWRAEDWFKFVVPGPGSRRGLARLLGRPSPYALSDKEFYGNIAYAVDLAHNTSAVLPELCTQDVQNCLCEFDKYMRVLLKEGKPRQTYPGV